MSSKFWALVTISKNGNIQPANGARHTSFEAAMAEARKQHSTRNESVYILESIALTEAPPPPIFISLVV